MNYWTVSISLPERYLSEIEENINILLCWIDNFWREHFSNYDWFEYLGSWIVKLTFSEWEYVPIHIAENIHSLIKEPIIAITYNELNDDSFEVKLSNWGIEYLRKIQ